MPKSREALEIELRRHQDDLRLLRQAEPGRTTGMRIAELETRILMLTRKLNRLPQQRSGQ